MEHPRKEQTLFLDHLPNEMLEKIFAVLPQKGLAAIATLSRRFSSIVEPDLYRAIHISLPSLDSSGSEDDVVHEDAVGARNFDQSWQEGDALPPSYGNFHGLLANLAGNPKLRSHIESITFHSKGRAWHEKIARKILELAPSLQELAFYGYGPPRQLILPVGSTLSTLRADFQHPGAYLPESEVVCMIAGYLSIPSLRSLQIGNARIDIDLNDMYNMYNMYRMVIAIPVENRRLSPLVDLQFVGCSDPYLGCTLPQAILSVRALRRLVFERNVNWQEDHSQHGSYWIRSQGEEIKLAISEHKESLEELVIASSDGARSYSPRFFEMPWTNFAKLKRLAIPISFVPENQWFLPGPEMTIRRQKDLHLELPMSLEVLHLEYSMEKQDLDYNLEKHTLQLQRLAQNKGTYLPNLKHVTWWYSQQANQLPADSGYGTTYGAMTALEQLALDFAEVNVNFNWVSTPALKDTPMGRPLGITCNWSRDPPPYEHRVDERGRVDIAPYTRRLPGNIF